MCTDTYPALATVISQSLLDLPASSVLVNRLLAVRVTVGGPVVLATALTHHDHVDCPHFAVLGVPLVADNPLSESARRSILGALATLLLLSWRVVDLLVEVVYLHTAALEVGVTGTVGSVPIVVKAGHEQLPPRR